MLRTAFIAAAIGVGIAAAPVADSAPTTTSPTPAPGGGSAVYYPNCAAARAAGVAPIYKGQPG